MNRDDTFRHPLLKPHRVDLQQERNTHSSAVVCMVRNSGPIPMFIGSELFRQGPRPKAMAVVGISLWVATFVIAMGFEPLQVD